MKLSYIIIAALSLSLMACGGQEPNTNHGHSHGQGGHTHGNGSHSHYDNENHSQEEFIVDDSLSNPNSKEDKEQSHIEHSHEGQHPHNH